MNADLDPILLVVVALPALVALGLVAIGFAQTFTGVTPLPERVWRGVGLATGFVTFALTLVGVAYRFDPEALGFQFVASVGSALATEPRILLGVDGIGLCFLLSTAGLAPLAILSSRTETADSVRSWIFVVLMLESSLLGAIASLNLHGFLFFWAQTLLPILHWLGRWGGEDRGRMATRVWATESVGLAGLLFVAFALAEMSEAQLGQSSLDLVRAWGGPGAASGAGGTLLDLRIPAIDQRWLFGILVLALVTRLPLVPLHFWLPGAHAASPTGLSILLATGFAQTAAIGLLRFALPIFPQAALEARPILAAIGIVALGYASLVALVQKELNRLMAYTAVGYAGFAMFGIATMNVQGLTGAVVQLLTHGLATAGIFVMIGALAQRRGTTEVAAFGGLARPMPVCAAFFGLMVFSLMGFPLLGGFIGDLFVLLGSLDLSRELSVAALAAMGVAAAYLLWVQRRVFFGPVEEPANRGLIDLDRIERAILLAIAIPILAIGVYPNPLLRRIEPAVLEILHQMGRVSLPESETEAARVAAAVAEERE
jgi:NADH-quinone oxidoreductase subunit M